MMGDDNQIEFDSRLVEHRRIWDEKPALREIYSDFHKRLEAACPPGPLLDIGGGSAHFKDYRPEVTSLDILPFPGIDIVADAHEMPVPDNHFAGIVMIDVLHHLQRPIEFLREAHRVLRPGGRLAMIEPGMSTLSRHFYTNFHQEPVIMSADPFSEGVKQSGDDPFDSNQAIPTLLFAKKHTRRKIESTIPGLIVTKVYWLSLLAYPLSGGFKKWSAWPAALVPAALMIETAIMPFIGPFAAFRLMIIIEKKAC